MSKNIFFSVGEPSGDQHAARLVSELRRMDPDIRSRGFGGQQMEAAGCQVDRDLTQHAVFGLLEVLPKLHQFFQFADQAEEIFRRGNVDAVVLVDFPGFNWHIAKRAKKHGIPVYYYCPPQLWAWAGWRRRKMRRTVDHVLAVLPIEEKYFTKHNIPTTYVGHPFFDAVNEADLDARLLSRFDSYSECGQPLVAVLPGSRDHEVQRSWPMMLESIRRLHRQHAQARFLVAAHRDRQCLECRDKLTDDDKKLPIEFYVDRTSEVIQASQCAMMVSGSVSLEMMARGTPAAVVYRIGRVLHTFVRMVVRPDSMTLPNLMSDRKIFPEFVSVGNPEPGIDFLTKSIDAMLGDSFYYRGTMAQLDKLRKEHARGGATRRAAAWIHDSLSDERADQLPTISRKAA